MVLLADDNRVLSKEIVFLADGNYVLSKEIVLSADDSHWVPEGGVPLAYDNVLFVNRIRSLCNPILSKNFHSVPRTTRGTELFCLFYRLRCC